LVHNELDRAMDLRREPKLRFLHSENALNRLKLEQFRRLSTNVLKFSLAPGQQGALKVRPDGTVLDVPGPWRGRLAVATRPRGGDWLEDEASGWRRAGLNVVVSLLEPEEAAQLELIHEREAAEATGIHFISFPIPDRGVPASMQDTLLLLRNIAEELEKGSSVAVHCRQGIGRSGLIAAGALVVSGVPTERAMDVVSAARGQTIPETSDQLEWLRSLPSEHLLYS
jgi:protein-tyrosine phosphatase